MLQALYLISRALSDPLTPSSVRIEPRVIAGETLTAWDLQIDPPETQVEAKLNPSKADVLEFLARAARAHQSGARCEFRLVYGQDVPLLAPLKKLLRLAEEAQGDPSRFEWLLTFERRDGTEDMLVSLGDTPQTILDRITLEPLSEKALEREIRQSSERIAGSAGGAQLVALLFRKLAKAVPHRAVFSVCSLIDEARAAGISLRASPEVSTPGLPVLAKAALVILQATPGGIPPAVLAEALRRPVVELETVLARFVENGQLRVTEGLWHLEPVAEPLTHSDLDDLLSRTLDALLDFIQPDPTGAAAIAQVPTVIDLAERCTTTHPKTVARVFQVIHKSLKCLGDKHRMLEVARLSIEAARQVGPNRTEEFVKYEAQALICGESWVYQRVGRLTEALAAAEKSLRLGEDIRWWRNTTFCRKCIGRLLRMQAEHTKVPEEKSRLLVESIASLKEALERFSSSADDGPNQAEMGDCYSLLGRSYLVMGQFKTSAAMVREANELLTKRTDKDYLDLLILWGELAAAQGERDAAEGIFGEALEIPTAGDAEKTEMRARAYFQRARNRQARRQQDGAVADYQRATAIWRELGERDRADEAEWRVVLLTEPSSREFRDLLKLLEPERFGVCLAVLRQRKEELAQLSGSFRGRRTEAPSENYWQRLISEARKNNARGSIDW